MDSPVNDCQACSYGGSYYKHTCREGSRYSLDNYQDDAGTTAIYPGAGTGDPEAVTYTILGLIGEAGELANKWKKVLRGDYGPSQYDFTKAELRAELGDVLWYVANLATELDVQLGTIAEDNYKKLTSRRERGVISGSGDYR